MNGGCWQAIWNFSCVKEMELPTSLYAWWSTTEHLGDCFVRLNSWNGGFRFHVTWALLLLLWSCQQTNQGQSKRTFSFSSSNLFVAAHEIGFVLCGFLFLTPFGTIAMFVNFWNKFDATSVFIPLLQYKVYIFFIRKNLEKKLKERIISSFMVNFASIGQA